MNVPFTEWSCSECINPLPKKQHLIFSHVFPRKYKKKANMFGSKMFTLLTRERSKAEIFNFDETCYIRQKTPQTNFRAIQSRPEVGGSGGKPPPKSAPWAGHQETTCEKNPYNARLYAESKVNHRCTLFLQKQFNVVAKFWKSTFTWNLHLKRSIEN